MGDDLEEHVYSILRGRRDFDERYPSISEFKTNLRDGASLAEEESRSGWVLWNSEHYTTQHLHRTITHLLKRISSNIWFYVVQFWAVVKVEGRYHYLSASHQPFYIPSTHKSHCRYRNLCVDQVYRVDVEEGAEEEPLGGVGRAYRNKQPESTPDFRLYSLSEFPLRDEAARCGFRAYLVLPLFDQTQRYGVLEFLSYHTEAGNIISSLNKGLQMAGLSSTHTNFTPFSYFSKDAQRIKMPHKYNHTPDKEITEILQLCIEFVPGLSLAQVWIPCKECASKGTTVFCMERTSFITARGKRVNSCQNTDPYLYDYLQGCEYHNLQVLNCGSLYDASISKDPLAHYARRARLSHCFTVCIESVSNSNEAYALQFLLQSKDASGDSSIHLLSSIIEMKLKTFKFLAREQFPVELDIQSMQVDGIDMLDVMNSHIGNFFKWNFIQYMETADLCRLQPSSTDNRGWVFSLPDKDIKMKKIVKFMKQIAKRFTAGSWMVQFWASKVVGNKCYLETSNQPYALGCLAKCLATFRKKCLKHHYFVDEEAKKEELGPPGRVFRNGHPEFTPNLLLYPLKEFPMRNHAAHCCLQQYFALPVFNEQDHKCVGVMELIGFNNYVNPYILRRALKAAELYSPHIDAPPIYLASGDVNAIRFKKKALNEVADALRMITKIPQLHLVNVWVPRIECVGTAKDLSCMELALSSNNRYKFMPTDEIHWIHVHPGKGIVGMVLASENKSCFCRNISEFSIVDHPPSHYEMIEKGNICFAICLQSSYTGNLYVLQFFLYEGPETYKNLHSFLNFLMPVMNKELPSFKVANGKELGQELVVGVIEFSEANTPISYDYELDQPCVFPVKFKSVFYGQQEHQHTEEQHDIEFSQPNQSTIPESDQLNLPPENQCIEERRDIEFCQPNQSTFPESDQLNLPTENQCIEERHDIEFSQPNQSTFTESDKLNLPPENQGIKERRDIEFCQLNQSTFPESDQLNLPPENQCIEEQQVQSNPEGEQRKENNVVASNLKKTIKKKKETVSLEELESNCHKTLEEAASDIGEQQVQSNPEREQRKEHNVVATNFKKTKKGKRKHGVSLQELESNCHKTLEEAASDIAGE